MTAAELIEKIITRYREAEHYEDRGTGLVLINAATQANFQTSFDRPDKLSFSLDVHYADDDEEAKDAYRIEHDAGLIRFEPEDRGCGIRTLDHALAALTGVSFSAAHIVPKLLIPDVVSGRQLFELGSEHALRADVSIDGEPHAVL